MQKNLIYLFDDPLNIIGLCKKVSNQSKCFAKFGYTVYVVYKEYPYAVIYDYNKNTYEKTLVSSESDYYTKVLEFIKSTSVQVLYVRKKNLNYFLMDFFDKFYSYFKEAKMVMEFPTIPYDNEGMEPDQLKADIHYRNYLHNYFKISTNFNNLDRVFNIESIPIINGVDLDSIKPKKSRTTESKNIKLISASSMYFWNGYERIIKGLYNYVSQQNNEYGVYIDFVGQGNETDLYKSLTSEYGLNEYITFYGDTAADELDKLFDKADIGLNKFGVYKTDTDKCGGIRVAEYASRGLPIVYSGQDIVFGGQNPYLLQFPNDPSDIDINQIVEFYKEISKDTNLSKNIRRIAENIFNWDIYTEKIVKRLDEI